MPYSEVLEKKIADMTGRWKGLEQKKMFGGICYLQNGNMCFGIYQDCLIVRLGAEEGEKRLREKDVDPFDITGRPMKGWVMVAQGSWKRRDALKKWLEAGRKFALSLPAK